MNLDEIMARFLRGGFAPHDDRLSWGADVLLGLLQGARLSLEAARELLDLLNAGGPGDRAAVQTMWLYLQDARECLDRAAKALDDAGHPEAPLA